MGSEMCIRDSSFAVFQAADCCACFIDGTQAAGVDFCTKDIPGTWYALNSRIEIPMKMRMFLSMFLLWMITRVLYGNPSVHGAVFRNRKSYGLVRCVLRNRKSYAVWFSAVFRYGKYCGAVRFGALSIKLKNVSCEYDRWVVGTQLCKLRDTLTPDTFIRRACSIFLDIPFLICAGFVNKSYDVVVDTQFLK